MSHRTVFIDGQAQKPMPGFHRFIDGNPPRLECVIRARRCHRCARCTNIWMTDDWRWKTLARRWWRKILCVECFRALTCR